MVKADLHNHLRTSSRLVTGDFNNAVNAAVKTLGEGGILGVVNFSDFRYEHLIQSSGYERQVLDNGSAVYIPSRNIYLVKGQEIPTLEGHVLAFGASPRVHLRENRSLKTLLKKQKIIMLF